ncbi:MAG: exodeoxyribonuclease VII small subunit [Chloroflexota bacterium]
MDEQLSFEEALGQLERTVQALQEGGLTLEQSLSLFEAGMALAHTCDERLDAAELRITEVETDLEQEGEDKDE